MRAWAARLTRKRSPSLPDHVSAATPDSRVLPSVLLTPAAPLSSSTSRRTASTVAASPAAPSSSSSTLFSPSLAAPPTSATRKRRALFRAAARWTWIAFLALVLLGLHELVTGDARDDDARAGTERASARRASTLRHRPAGLTQRRDLWLVDESSTSPSAGDVTAVLVVQPHQREEGGTLSKATLRVLSERVRHLCAHAFFRHVVVWSNAGALGAQDLAGCAPGKLRVHNSPHDLGALARYLACSHASTPLCYFSADVHASAHSRARADPAPTPLRALYAQFIRDPEGPILLHVADESGMRAHWDDCFFRRPFLHTCAGAAAIATSQGGGVFTSQARVDDFLLTATELGFSRHETAKADDAFAIFQNEPPLVITNAGGAGETRDNDDDDQGGIFVELALSRLAALIDPDGAVLADDGASLDADDTAYAVAQDAFRESRAPPLAPHPWAQHARAACSDDTCLLLSNVNLLPPPDLVPWPGPHVRLQDWHERLGRLHGDAKRWASEWPYHAAVDGRFDTALRSPEPIRRGEYVALGLLSALDPRWMPRVALHLVLEPTSELATLAIDVSLDGYKWYEAREAASRTSSELQFDTLPHGHPPRAFSSSSDDGDDDDEHDEERASMAPDEGWAAWLTGKRSKRAKLVEHKLMLYSELITSHTIARVDGWRYVRVRARDDSARRWAIYEMWIERASGERSSERR